MPTEEQEYNEFVTEAFKKAGEIDSKFKKLSEQNRKRFIQQYLEPAFTATELQKFMNQLNILFSQKR